MLTILTRCLHISNAEDKKKKTYSQRFDLEGLRAMRAVADKLRRELAFSRLRTEV